MPASVSGQRPELPMLPRVPVQPFRTVSDGKVPSPLVSSRLRRIHPGFSPAGGTAMLWPGVRLKELGETWAYLAVFATAGLPVNRQSCRHIVNFLREVVRSRALL